MTYVTSDIHGRSDLFDRMLDEIGFSDVDMLYIVGDIGDRGPDGILLFERIMSMPNVFLIVGNHDDMLIRSVSDRRIIDEEMFAVWMNNGGLPTYNGFARRPVPRRREILDYILQAPDHLDLDVGERKFHLVHGSVASNRDDRIWERTSPFLPRTVPGRVAIVGHTPVCHMHPSISKYLSSCGDHMAIYHGDGFIDIDCGCGLAGRVPKACLACLRLDDMEEFYVM